MMGGEGRGKSGIYNGKGRDSAWMPLYSYRINPRTADHGTTVFTIAGLRKKWRSRKISLELLKGKGNEQISYKITGRDRSGHAR
jgi:hypothetical protein